MIQTAFPQIGAKTGARLTGTGKALPSRVVPNKEFETFLDTSDEWIRTRTGIQERRYAEPEDTTSQFAARAAFEALSAAGLEPADIDCIILSTTTPDKRFPCTANIVQRAIGAHNAYGYDISVACSGFIFALASAHAQIQAGLARRVLVISAELYSSIIDFTDRNTCILFGDGAGAVVLEGNVNRDTGGEEDLDQLFSTEYPVDKRGQRSEVRRQNMSGIRDPEPGTGNLEPDMSGIIAVSLHSEASGADILTCEGGGTQGRSGLQACDSGTIRMDGKAVFRNAVTALADRSREVLCKAGVNIEDVDCIIPHQANIRILEKLARNLGCSMERIFVNLEYYGNTSSASVPIALDEAVKSGRVKQGDLVLCAAAGAGFSSGSMLLRL